MELKDGVKTFYARDRKAWRAWLNKNHKKEKLVWLVIYNKGSETSSVNYVEAVEEALCFGWIDSKANKRDGESRYQSFAQRKPKGHWSALNRQRVKKLIAEGQMTPAGQAMINLAKKTGTWTVLKDVDALVLPDDLKKLFDKNKKAFKNFDAFPPSSKRVILLWIMTAKQPGTRKKRLVETVKLAADNIRANHWQK